MPRAKASSNGNQSKLQQDYKKAKELIKSLQKEIKEMTALQRKSVSEMKKVFDVQLMVAAETAYDTGFNDALDELEHFTAARDQYLLRCEAQFEKEYAKQLSQSHDKKRVASSKKSTSKKKSTTKKKTTNSKKTAKKKETENV